MSDPVEKIVAIALECADIAFERGAVDRALDFYCPDFGVHIECKQFHSARIADQMSRHPNVIAIQGIGAARAFAAWLEAKG